MTLNSNFRGEGGERSLTCDREYVGVMGQEQSGTPPSSFVDAFPLYFHQTCSFDYFVLD